MCHDDSVRLLYSGSCQQTDECVSEQHLVTKKKKSEILNYYKVVSYGSIDW